MATRRPLIARRLGVLVASGAAALGLLALPPSPAEAGPSALPAAPSGPAGPSVTAADGFRVVEGAAGDVRVTYRPDEPLPITDARPEFSLDGEPIGTALVSPDGRTLVLAAPPDPADLDVALSGAPLDEAAPPAPVGGAAPAPPAPGPLLGVDPSTPGDLAVAADDYDLDPITADGLPLVETVGHVEGPVDAGAVPVVLFLHGRHAFCYKPDGSDGGFRWPCPGKQLPVPSQLGYTYVQEVLASQGFLTVSVAANGINAQDGDLDDSGAQARADLVEHHLDLLADGSLDAYLPAGTTPDLSQTVLVGHSRGGEGVNRVAEQDTPGGPYEVVGQVLLGPTNFGLQATPYVPSVTVLPYCDGDVSDLRGQVYTDVPRDLVADDPALHSTVLVMGANHNFFNTEWTPGQSVAPSTDDANDLYARGYCADDRDDDADPRLEPEQQQDVGTAYIAGAVRLFTGESDLAPLFDGTQARTTTTQDLDIRTHAIGALRDVVRPGLGSTASDGTATSVLCSGSPEDCLGEVRYISAHFLKSFVPDTPVREALRISWSAEGQTAGLAPDDPLDLSDDTYLDLRVLLPPLAEDGRFDVALSAADGRTTTVTPVDGGRVAALPRRQYGAAAVAQVLRTPLADVSGVDLARITQVDLVARTDAGTAWLPDAAGVGDDLPDPGDARAPALDLAPETTVEEGDGRSTVEIPYTLDAPAPAGSSVRVVPIEYGRTGPLGNRGVDVDVPAGATEGTIPLPLEGDDVHERDQSVRLQVFPLRGVAPADADTLVRITEDDPRSTVTLRARPRVVREGARAVVEGVAVPALAPRTDLLAYVARGPGPVLRVGDLRRSYLEQFDLLDRDPRDPAVGPDFPAYARVVDGGGLVLSLPTRRDGVAEGRERVTLRLRGYGSPRATVVVRD